MARPPTDGGRRERRPFYGWVVVAALSVAGGVSVFMGIGNFGIFVAPMSEELGVGNSAFGWALSARLLGFAVSGPLIGRLIDRKGARVPLAAAALLFGGSAMAMSLVDAGWQMIGLTLFAGLAGFWGSSTLYLTIPIAKWFVRKRGRAMSLFFPGVPFGIGVASPLTQLLVDAAGWRAAWVVLGAAGGLTIAALSLILIRNRPEDLGLQPDGDPDEADAPQDASAPRRAARERSWTVREAMRTGTFWRISAAYGLLMAAMGSIGVFLGRVPLVAGRRARRRRNRVRNASVHAGRGGDGRRPVDRPGAAALRGDGRIRKRRRGDARRRRSDRRLARIRGRRARRNRIRAWAC